MKVAQLTERQELCMEVNIFLDSGGQMQERGISTIKGSLFSHKFFYVLKFNSSLQALVPITWVGSLEWSSPMSQTSLWKVETLPLIPSGHGNGMHEPPPYRVCLWAGKLPADKVLTLKT